MTITVEDGSVVTSATSFITLAESDTYFEDRNMTTWSGSSDDDTKEAALIKAADWMNTLSWEGLRVDADQTLCWPREGLYYSDGYAVDDDTIPTQIKHAQMEAAYREFNTAGSLEPDEDRGGQIKREKIDVLETEYFGGAPSGTVHNKVKNLLRQFLKSSLSFKLERT